MSFLWLWKRVYTDTQKYWYSNIPFTHIYLLFLVNILLYKIRSCIIFSIDNYGDSDTDNIYLLFFNTHFTMLIMIQLKQVSLRIP